MKIPSILFFLLPVAQSNDVADFRPLQCNEAIDMETCRSWKHFFGSRAVFKDRVVVPCGRCYTMNTPRDTITFADGLDIQGKLVFPDGLALTVYSPAIIVQGVLEVNAYSKPIDGNPLIRFVMTGTQDNSFDPIDANAKACYGLPSCSVGSKSITVAGGRVSFLGVPPNTPAWLSLEDIVPRKASSASSIVVSNSVRGTWDVGAELLITSHTRRWNGHQVRKIAQISNHAPGLVEIRLNEPIDRPSTMQDDSRFAVEVALLSRNIVWEGETNKQDATHGGHFWVFHTPDVEQSIEGVEIRNFGQQGILGRYPLHFHHCKKAQGSRMVNNAIVDSNQRCVVVHATDRLKIEDNVAFNTKGHCYMLEIGVEVDNVFRHNLGAATGTPKKILAQQTDFLPSTFWITHPTNSWYDNVAAGSLGSGYWFETTLSGGQTNGFSYSTPNSLPIIAFKDNVAHSNADKGFRTYPLGYFPKQEQLIEGLKSYRNEGSGIFLHNTRNLRIKNALVADNKHIGIDIERAGGITIVGSTIIGYSDSFKATEGGSNPCIGRVAYGIDLHSWTPDFSDGGVVLANNKFEGFYDIGCPQASAIHFDGNTKTGNFDAFTKTSSISSAGGERLVDFCDADESSVKNAYLTDVDSSVLPSNVPSESSTFISDNSPTLDLIRIMNCVPSSKYCALYCHGVCLRTVRFQVDPHESESFTLKACSTRSPRCTSVSGYRLADSEDQKAQEPRLYDLQLLSGENYIVHMLDSSGVEIWPRFIQWKEVDAPCKSDENGIAFVETGLGANDCDDLIRNGDMEQTDGLTWLHRFGGLKYSEERGVSGSTAIASDSPSALTTFMQYLDSRCIRANIGHYYEIQAEIRLESANGETFHCDSDKRRCPVIGVYGESCRFFPVATVDSELVSPGGFQLAQGYLYLDEKFQENPALRFYVRSGVNGHRMLVDNVSMHRIDNPERYCRNVIQWPSDDPALLWHVDGNGEIRSDVVDLDGGAAPAIRFRHRNAFGDAMVYDGWRVIETICLQPGTRWKFVAKVRLENKETHQTVDCEKSGSCPTLRFVLRDESGKRILLEKSTPDVWGEQDEWSVLKMFLTFPKKWDGSIQKIVLEVGEFESKWDLVLFDLTMRPF